MPFDIQRILALAVLLCTLSTVHCQAIDLLRFQDPEALPYSGLDGARPAAVVPYIGRHTTDSL